MSTKSDTCTHEHGGYAPGPVYTASLYLPGGMILTSSPGTGEEISKLLKDFRKAQDAGLLPKGTGTKLHYVGPSESRILLIKAAELWRRAARTVEQHFVPKHKGFKANSEICLTTADKLIEQARALAS